MTLKAQVPMVNKIVASGDNLFFFIGSSILFPPLTVFILLILFFNQNDEDGYNCSDDLKALRDQLGF